MNSSYAKLKSKTKINKQPWKNIWLFRQLFLVKERNGVKKRAKDVMIVRRKQEHGILVGVRVMNVINVTYATNEVTISTRHHTITKFQD